MTRLALGAKWGRPVRPPLAWESLASNVASAATPKPPLDALKKLRRVIAWSPPHPNSKAGSRWKCRPPAPVHPGGYRVWPHLDSGTLSRHSFYLKNNPDDIGGCHAEPAARRPTACGQSPGGIRNVIGHR